LYLRGIGPKTQRWTELSDGHVQIENEELIVRNTYLNSQMAPFADLNIGKGPVEEKQSYTLKWADEGKQKRPLTEENLDEDDLVNKHNPAPIMHHREYHRQVKPIVKGSRVRHRAQSQQPPTQASLAAAATKSKFLAKTSNQNNAAPTANNVFA